MEHLIVNVIVFWEEIEYLSIMYNKYNVLVLICLDDGYMLLYG